MADEKHSVCRLPPLFPTTSQPKSLKRYTPTRSHFHPSSTFPPIRRSSSATLTRLPTARQPSRYRPLKTAHSKPVKHRAATRHSSVFMSPLSSTTQALRQPICSHRRVRPLSRLQPKAGLPLSEHASLGQPLPQRHVLFTDHKTLSFQHSTPQNIHYEHRCRFRRNHCRASLSRNR